MSLEYKIAKMMIMGEDPYQLVVTESKIVNETYKFLIESVINWNYLQIQLVKDLIDMPEVQIWGHGFDTEGFNWSSYDSKSKILMLMKFLDKTGILKKIRDYINTTNNSVVRVGTNEYDIKDITSEFKPFSENFLQELRSSKVYKDILDICVDSLKSVTV